MKNECDGSGKHKLCSTKTQHRHCECGEPMMVIASRCRLCDLESQGVSIHNSQDYIRESREHTDIWSDTDLVGFSSFKQKEDVFQHGTEGISMKEIDRLMWNSKKRERPSEPIQGLPK